MSKTKEAVSNSQARAEHIDIEQFPGGGYSSHLVLVKPPLSASRLAASPTAPQFAYFLIYPDVLSIAFSAFRLVFFARNDQQE